MQITERLSGSHLSQDAILLLKEGDRVTVMRRLDKPGQWFVMDERSEPVGFLTAASAVAKALNSGRRIVHAVIVGVGGTAEDRRRSAVRVHFQLADLA